MKKSFYYLSLLLGLVLGMTMFTACGGDDDNNNGGGASGGGETGFVPGKFMGPKRVFGDNLTSSFGSDSRRYEMTYNSDNLVTKMKIERVYNDQVENTREYEVSYADKQVTINRTSSGSDKVKQYVFTIGNNGFAESCTEGYLDSSNKDVITYEYDSEGHMTKITLAEANDEPWSGAFTWKDGNIIEQIGEDNKVHLTYTYSSASNVVGLFIRADIGGIDDLYLPEFYYMGLLGKGTANLVESYNVAGSSETGNNVWTLDNAGRPTKCVTTTTGRGGGTPTTYTYFWTYR